MTHRVVVFAVLLAFGCHHRSARPEALRIGFFPTVTHEAALVLLERGELARALAPLAVEPRPFNAGPEAMEALFAGAIDACYVGPMPAVNAYLRSRGDALRIVAGAASGGAAFVVAKDSNITSAESLHGKKLATPSLGNTQDVALRVYLRDHGLKTQELGGDVQVMPLANPDIIQLMRTGKLDGAWVVEPTVARLVAEAGARVFLDERERWPGGRYPSAVLVVTRKLATEHPERVQKLVQAHVDAVRFLREHRDQARALVQSALITYAKKKLPQAVLDAAFDHVTPEWEIPNAALEKTLSDGRALGYLPSEGELSQAVDAHWVTSVAR